MFENFVTFVNQIITLTKLARKHDYKDLWAKYFYFQQD